MDSKKLRKYGWKGHLANLPAAYLTGILAAKEALGKGIHEAILDIGLHKSVKGSAIYACALGAKKGGLKLKLGDNIVPTEDRITGRHISTYAESIKKDGQKYEKQFSYYLKNGVNPEKLHEHVDEIRRAISSTVPKKKEGSE